MLEASKVLDPWPLFDQWIEDAKGFDQYDAMALATASKDAEPSVRFVLFKGHRDQKIFFYTNYHSRKSRELEENPRASVSFFWAASNRQLRMSGVVAKATAAESDRYFSTRPRLSQLGARVSRQGRTLQSKEVFLSELDDEKAKWAHQPQVPRPEQWGGFTLTPHVIEFWQGQENRLHDRHLFERIEGIWQKQMLYP
jgi:pyridoxamine 5'-phosphate oxidase